jgi:hypothetical protein
MTNQINKIFIIFSYLLLSLLISSCSEGDRGFVPVADDPVEEVEADILITGGAVKGPLVNAEINVYKFELDKGSINLYNNALNVWFDLLDENDIQLVEDSISLGNIPEASVVNNLLDSTYKFGYVTELKFLQSELDKTTDFSKGKSLVNDYIAGKDINIETDEEINKEINVVNKETNSIVKDEVQIILDVVATLKELKNKINNVQTLTEKLLDVDSFSAASSLLNTYRLKESNSNKQDGFLYVQEQLNLLANQAGQFGLSAIRNYYNENVYDVYLNDFSLQNDPVARQNIIELKNDLDGASSVIEAEAFVEDMYRKEGNTLVKTDLAKLISKIITISDFHDLITGYDAFYHDFSLRSTFLSLFRINQIPGEVDRSNNPSLDAVFQLVTQTFQDKLEGAFRDSFIIKDDAGVSENRLSFGLSNSQGLLPGLNIGEYRGFIYMEALSSNKTIDINSGSIPILEKMDSIFHTDDILGNGNNLLEDETIYYLLDGEVQRDSDGKIITDSDLIKTDNKLLEVRPSFFVTPLTDFALGLSLENFKRLSNLQVDANSDLMPENKITEVLLKNTLQASAQLVTESFGIGVSGLNIYKSSPVRLPQMQYSQTSEQQAIQYRLSIENFSSFLNDIMYETSLKASEVIDLLISDLNDGQIDGRYLDEDISRLSDIPQLQYLLRIHPSERLIPGTNIPVSNIYFLMNQQHSLVLPSESLSVFPTKNDDIEISSPKGGVDTDLDGVLDNEDQFPEDATKSRNLNAGYAGIWSVNYDSTETEYMPFNDPFVFHLNKEQIEGVCTLEPCVGLGDTSTQISASYNLIDGPVNKDFTISPINDGSVIGFSAFATTPGNYLVKAELTTDVDPIQSYTFFVPIQVVDPKDIQIKFDPADPVPGKVVTTLFKVTKALCHLYPICEDLDLNDDVDDFLPLSLLNDIFSVNQQVKRKDNTLSYSSVTSKNLDQTAPDLSNIELNDTVSISVSFNAGERSLIAASYNKIVGDTEDADGDGVSDLNDFYPIDNLCSLEKDGLLDENNDGDVNELDSPFCFEAIKGQHTETFDVSFLNETWFYYPKRHLIVRANKYSSGYNGHINTPTLQGTKESIEEFAEDAVTKRIYFAYKNGAIDYYSLELQTIQNFTDSYEFSPVNSMHLLGTYLLVEYGSGEETKLFNSNSNLAVIGTDANYPHPGNAITINIDNQNLTSATNNLFNINWVLERESEELDVDQNNLINEIQILTTNDGLTINSGQTVFGDVIKVTLSFLTEDDRTISLERNIFVVGIDAIVFSEKTFNEGDALSLIFNGFNSELLSKDNKSLFVKWYKFNTLDQNYDFSLSDVNYPFVFEGKNIKKEDIIRSELYLQHGPDQLKISSFDAIILGDMQGYIPLVDQDISIIDNSNRTVSLTLLEPSPNYYISEIFTPLWKINGQKVENEHELFFPSLSSTTFRYGDIISVSYEFNVNGFDGETSQLVIGTVTFEDFNSTFSVTPITVEIGEDLSLTTDEFTETELKKIEARWRINGVVAKDNENPKDVDTGEYKDFSLFTYPGSKLSYGDRVELLLLTKDASIDRAFTHIAIASVGVNLESLANNQSDPENDLDSDNDGIPNHLDYFRYDDQCSLTSEGMPDDIDLDGINDLDELKNILKTNPNLSDTDSDGLSDYAEINVHNTDPIVKDSDGDGYLDGVEIDLGTDPNIANSSVNDNDFDGLSNDLELSNNTKVYVFDTDNDGLSDWFELNIQERDSLKENTNPLLADSDGDMLSDGVEIRVTFTDPTVADTDGDGINDGIEVVLKIDPNLQDTDADGILDSDESGLDFNVTIPSILFENDLKNYKRNFSTLLSVEQGTCFKTWLANNKPSLVKNTHVDQLDSNSIQEVAFASDKWNQIIRFDAQNKAFADLIELNIYDAKVTSINYDAVNSEILYVGFSDGWIRQYNSQTKQISEVFNTDRTISITTIVAHDEFLIAEQIGDDDIIHHSVFNITQPPIALDENPASSSISDYSYQNSIWFDNSALSRLELISFDENFSLSTFIRETIEPGLADPVVSSDIIELSTAIESPLFIEQLTSKSILNFGNGRSYNLSDNLLLANSITPFDLGFEHQNHRIISQPNASFLEMTIFSDLDAGKYWSFNSQLTDKDLITVLPVGQHLLAISFTEPSKSFLKDGKIAFQHIVLGDEDGDSIPDWWNNLSDSLTVAEFNDYQLTDDAIIPDLLDGTPNVDDSLTAPVLVDTDGDGICDHWETSLFNTNPLLRNTDDDGMSDDQELKIVIEGTLDCSDYPTFTVISDPLNPDSDADGLSDGDEAFIYFTKILNPDSDGDGLTDYQEIFITNTDPNNDQENGDGDSDGDNLSDSDELNLYNTDFENRDSDSDGLDDDKEVLVHNTNPNNSDSDGDGLLDEPEVTDHFTDPSSIDSDTDGISDGDELNLTNEFEFKSDPNVVDTDGDGLSDFIEFGFVHPYSGELLVILDNPKLKINPDDIDTDKDGICDKWEVLNFLTNPAEADTDGDGLTDAQELGINLGASDICLIQPESVPISSSTTQDTDLDGILDGDEVLILSTNPKDKDSDDNNINDNLEDPDQDGLNNYQELYQTLTDPLNSDSDGNGINDGDDDIDGDGLSNKDEINIHGTDSLNADSDGDGINDKEEIDNNLNPTLPDTDGDSLSDSDEINIYHTDPNHPDTDRDGSNDDEEINDKKSDPNNPDTDNDFLLDGQDEKPLNPDADADGIPDGIEVNYLSTDPDSNDSDQDGLSDGYEAWVFAFNYDSNTNLEQTTLMKIGEDLDQDLNSHAKTSVWPKPQHIKFSPNNLDRIVVDLVDVLDSSYIKGRLYIQRYSNPAISDSDGDGLFDSTEFEIEKAFGNEYSEVFELTSFNPLALNSVNFKVSDPWNIDSNATKEIDSDDDGIPDFYEIKYTLTDPNNPDSDLNGINDALENPDLDMLNNLQEIYYGSDPYIFDEALDTDGDGLLDIFETLLLANYDIDSQDSNNDGILDGLEDADGDGLTNLEEIQLGTDPSDIESVAISIDSDNDGLFDFYELKITKTDPQNNDSDGDGILDGQDDLDGDGLNSFVEFLMGSSSLVKNKALDSDGDGLTDVQEVLITLTNPNSADSNPYLVSDSDKDFDNDTLTNIQEINLLTDPYSPDIFDGAEDVDGDYFTNLLEQVNGKEAVVNPDNDDDTIPDGIEALLLNTDIFGSDTDGDGLNDQAELKLLNQTDTQPWLVREIQADEFCSDQELRISAVAGKDYCFTIEYLSYPTLVDSDNDGVADRSVNVSDNSIILDYYPLDSSCFLATDGFTKSDDNVQCFSSWMGEGESIDLIKQAEWIDTSNAQPINHADIMFFNTSWDSIVVYNALTETYGARISIKEEINTDPVSLIDFEFSKTDKLVYLLYSDSTIEAFNVQTGLVQTLVDQVIVGAPSSLKILNANRLILETRSAPNSSNFYLLDNTGSRLGDLLDQAIDIKDSVTVCANTDCNEDVSLYGFIKNSTGANADLGRLDIDLLADLFVTSVLVANIPASDVINGPIKLSQDSMFIQLGSGQVLSLLLEDTGTDLSRSHKGKTYDSYFDFVEYADHFVGVVDVDLTNIPGGEDVPNTQNGLIVIELESIKDTLKVKLDVDESINDLKELNQYLLPPQRLEEQIFKLIPFVKTPALEMALIKKSNDTIVIEQLGLFDGDADLMTGLFEKVFSLDDNDAADKFLDLDKDGLSNVEEYFFGTDPSNEDSDADGWFDIDEIINGTDPNNNLSF